MAVRVLTDPPATHDGNTYNLTGPDLAHHGRGGRRHRGRNGTDLSGYQNETEAEAYASRAVYGAPDWQVSAWVSTYQAIALGEPAPTTHQVRRLLGRPATSLAELLRIAE